MKNLLLLFCLILLGSSSMQAQWTEQTSGVTTQLVSVSAPDDNVAWVCGYANGVRRTTNGGTTWTNATGTGIATMDLYNIWAFDADNALVTGSAASTFVYKTTNGGTTWTQVFTQTGGFINVILMTSPLTGIMQGDPVGGRWSLWRTANGGLNWDSTGLYVPQAGAEAGWNNGMFTVGNNIWFGTNNTRIYYSSNAGVTWGSQTTPELNSYAVWFNTPLMGMSGGANVFATSNSGTNWATIPAAGTGNVAGITSLGASTWWMVRQAAGIFKTTNNGANWTTEYTAPAGTHRHIGRSRTGTRMWATRTNGGIAKNDGLVGINPIAGEVPSSYALSQNYPNPFNPTTNLKFSVPVSGMVKITVFDALGREVSTLVNENKPAGTYEVDLDASSLNSGIYFYSIQAGNFKDTKKMMLIK